MFHKITIGLILSVLVLVLIFSTINKGLKTTSFVQPTHSQLPYIEDKRAKFQELSSQTEDFKEDTSELMAYLEEFKLPGRLKKEIQEASQESDIDRDSSESPVSKEELEEAGLALSQIAQSKIGKENQNIIAGYKVSNEAFDKIFKAALPEEGFESKQAQSLGAQALVNLGFSALEQFDFEEAEQAFEAVIEHYPQAESVAISYLEYARLLFEQGRLNEAKAVITEAINKYSDDQEFVSLAKQLEQTISSYE